MNVEHYTPIHFSKRSLSAAQVVFSNFETILLSLLVILGFIGSIYLFDHAPSTQYDSSSNIGSNFAPDGKIASMFISSEASDGDFDDYIAMPGKLVAGERFDFSFLKDDKASRYVMEMGDGVRLIVTQQNLSYTYAASGKYVIELKEIKDGLFHLVGTKKVKVK